LIGKNVCGPFILTFVIVSYMVFLLVGIRLWCQTDWREIVKIGQPRWVTLVTQNVCRTQWKAAGYTEPRISTLVPHFCQLWHVITTLYYTVTGYLMSTLLNFIVVTYINIMHDS